LVAYAIEEERQRDFLKGNHFTRVHRMHSSTCP
jgi:hypothetical protein